MSTPESPPTWPPPWARSVAFLVGIALMVYETVIDEAAHLIVYGPAFALTGLPLARGVEAMVDKLGALLGKGPKPS